MLGLGLGSGSLSWVYLHQLRCTILPTYHIVKDYGSESRGNAATLSRNEHPKSVQ